METIQYTRALARSWWVILVVVVLGGLAGFAFYEHATPKYQASVKLIVTLQDSSMDAISAQAVGNAQAQSLAQVAPTDPSVLAAKKAAGVTSDVHVSASAVKADTTSTEIANPFVSITVQSTDQDAVAPVANAFVKTLKQVTTDLTGANNTPYTVQSLNPAATPGSAFSPSWKKTIGLGLFAGLIIGYGLAMLREVLDRTVHNSDELRELSDLPLLGTVPRELPKKPLPAVTDPRSARAEAYRQVRTTVVNHTDKRPLLLSFTSAMPEAGKTSVSSNVATVLARAGHRVALVDADLRRPQVAAVFGIQPRYGLSEVLTGTATLQDALVEKEDGKLGLVCSGRIPQNPSELLGGDAFGKVLDELSQRYEFVLIDTPPVLPVTDGLVVAPKVDGVVLVVRLGKTTRARYANSLQALDGVNAKIVGVVANQAGKHSDSVYKYANRYTPTRRAEESPAE